MSKRIKELAIKSGLISAEYNGFDSTDLTLAEKRFANLIIQDCIDILAEYRGKVTFLNEYTNHNHPIIEIKQHFGIKNE